MKFSKTTLFIFCILIGTILAQQSYADEEY